MRKAALLVNNQYEEVERNRKTKPAKSQTPRAANPNTRLNMQLKKIVALNEAQRQMISAFEQGFHVIAKGSAGTGKSYVGCFLALSELMSKNIHSVKIMRSAVPSREIGFLPGSLTEKIAVYEAPYKDIVNDLMQCGTAYESLTKKGSIEFMVTSYLRGLTFNDCVIIVDESQNMSFHELSSLMTRVGNNCRVILCGDTKQCDFTGKKDISGFEDVVRIANKMTKHFDVVEFNISDVVRSGFVKAWLQETEDDN